MKLNTNINTIFSGTSRGLLVDCSRQHLLRSETEDCAEKTVLFQNYISEIEGLSQTAIQGSQ